jgi:hypothetical protein
MDIDWDAVAAAAQAEFYELLHNDEQFKQSSKANRVKRMVPPTHSSNQVQPLDLSLFGVAKSLLALRNHMESVNIQTSHIINLMNAFLAAAVPGTS